MNTKSLDKKRGRKPYLGPQVKIKYLYWDYGNHIATIKYEYWEEGIFWFEDKVNIQFKKNIQIPLDAYNKILSDFRILLEPMELSTPIEYIKVCLPRNPGKIGVDARERIH